MNRIEKLYEYIDLVFSDKLKKEFDLKYLIRKSNKIEDEMGTSIRYFISRLEKSLRLWLKSVAH